MMAVTGGALAQTELSVFVSSGAMDADDARQTVRLLQQAMPEAAFTLELEAESGETLREKVLLDCAPDIAVTTPEEAAVWAREGMLLPLQGAIAGAKDVAPEVLDACTCGKDAFMAPLFARHRGMAVNRRMMEARQIASLLNPRDYPVWLPMQMQQVLEEFALAGVTGMDLWLSGEDGGAMLALVQAMYGAPLCETPPLLRSGALEAGVSWLYEMADSGLAAVAESREAALRRFFAGETAIFCGFTAQDAQRAKQEGFEDYALLAYPSSTGLPVRDFTVTGAAVFSSGDEARDRLGYDAAAFLSGDTRVGALFGGRNMDADDAFWLPCLGVSMRGAAVRSAFAGAMNKVLAGEMSPREAVEAACLAGGR